MEYWLPLDCGKEVKMHAELRDALVGLITILNFILILGIVYFFVSMFLRIRSYYATKAAYKALYSALDNGKVSILQAADPIAAKDDKSDRV